MTVTIRDVAQRAGVSVATVSRALNRSGPVREETRSRIEAAARALQYRPNNAARSLITRSTRLLGVLLPDLHGEFFSELIRAVDQAAQAEGYHLLLSSSHDNAADVEVALAGMHGRLDGLLVMAPRVEPRVLGTLLPGHLPIVLLNSPADGLACDSLRIDSFGGAREAVLHLASHGHERIAVINGPVSNFDAQERLRGYRAALKQAGLRHDPALEVAGDFTASGGYRAGRQLLAVVSPPTAIFATNDAMAMGALSALRDAGVAVPEDVALIGFDDVASTAFTSPALTTVQGPIGELGARAVARLAAAVSSPGRRAHREESLPVTMVLRRSCGCRSERTYAVGVEARGRAITTNQERTA